MNNEEYQTAALFTLAGATTYEDHMDQSILDRDVHGFVAAANALEKQKKALSYGKDIPLSKSANPVKHRDLQILHAKLGIAGEAGEVFDAETRDDVKKEVGDLLWYINLLLSRYDLTFSEVMAGNVEKLQKRYKSGQFTREEALNR